MPCLTHHTRYLRRAKRLRWLAGALIMHTHGIASALTVLNTSHDYHANQLALEEMFVSAARSRQSALDTPYALYRIEKDSLSQKLAHNLPKALDTTPGVMVQKTANGQASPYIRGFTGYRTLALIDGIRYNNSVYRDGPNEYFSLIDITSLEQLELLSGPGSMLYGSDAIGGTLSLHSKATDYHRHPANTVFLQGLASYQFSRAEHNHITRSEVQLGKGHAWGLHIGHSNKNMGEVQAAGIGTQPYTHYYETGVDARFDATLTARWTLTLVHQTLQQDDVWRTHSTLYARRFAGTTVGSDQRRLKDQQRSLSYIRVEAQAPAHWIDAARITLSHQRWDENGDRIKRHGARIIDYFDSRMNGLQIELASSAATGQVVYGVDYYQDNVDSGRTDYQPDGTLDRVRIQGPIGDDARYALLGGFLQGEFAIGDHLTLLAGGRYTLIQAHIGRFENPETAQPASFRDAWENMTTSVRATYHPDANRRWSLWGGISQSFRAPNIADLSRFGKSRSTETEVAASDLDPEQFTTYEVGLKTALAPLHFSGSYYYTHIDNFITSTPTGRQRDGLTEVSKQNSAHGYVQGVELTLRYPLSEQTDVFGHITWQEGELDRFQQTGSALRKTEPMSRIMPLTTVAGIKWRNTRDSFWLSLNMTHAAKADKLSSGDINDTQRIPPGGTPGYFLLNLYGGYRINDTFRVNWALNNLLDEAYRRHGSGSNEAGFGASVALTVRF